jgi:hypothetical protein
MSLRQAIRLQSCRNKCGWRHLFNYDATEQCEANCVDTIVFGGGRIAGTPFVQNGSSLGAQGIVLPGTGVTEHPAPKSNMLLKAGILIAGIALFYWFVVRGK